MDRWAGRVAVVTGASVGIGEAIAKELVKRGLTVVGIARRVDRIQELAKTLKGEKGKLLAMKADICNEKEILDAFAWIEKNTNGIDVLINNAGVVETDTLLDGSTVAWRRILDLNVVGLSICSREAVKSMKKKGADDGIIININSIAGHKIFSNRYCMYSASKFAVRALSEALYKELAASGSRIRVTELAKTVRAEKGKLLAVKADISKENEILDAFTWIEKNTNGIDVLVNNAGVAELDSLLDGSTDAWKKVLDLNVVGLSICSREAVKSMKKKGADDGVIININSVAGHSILSHAFSMYSASKFAVRALSEALYKELAASGSRIRVTNLSPGAVSTEMLMKIVNALPSDNPLHDNSLVILQPSDIAQAVVFILSVESRVFIPELKIQHNFLLPS